MTMTFLFQVRSNAAGHPVLPQDHEGHHRVPHRDRGGAVLVRRCRWPENTTAKMVTLSYFLHIFKN